MPTPEIPTTHYPSLHEALRLLPGIGPRQERERLGKAKYQASSSPSHRAELNGVQVTLAQLEELFINDQQGRPRVSPAGAALLLHLFEEGAFASFDDRKVEGNAEVLAQYAKGLATVIAFNYRRGAPRNARSQSGEAARLRRRSEQGLATAPPVAQVTGVTSVLFKSFIHRLD